MRASADHNDGCCYPKIRRNTAPGNKEGQLILHMKNHFIRKVLIGSLLVAFFTATGCYYNSTYPIDNPSMKRDPKLLGQWKPGKYSKEYYDIKAGKGPFLYNIDHYKYDSKLKKVVLKIKYTGYLSRVKSYNFMNVKKIWELDYKGRGKSIPAGRQKYMFYKLNRQGANFSADIVTSNIREKFSSSNDLKSFFEKYADLSFFYHSQTVKFLKK